MISSGRGSRPPDLAGTTSAGPGGAVRAAGPCWLAAALNRATSGSRAVLVEPGAISGLRHPSTAVLTDLTTLQARQIRRSPVRVIGGRRPRSFTERDAAPYQFLYEGLAGDPILTAFGARHRRFVDAMVSAAEPAEVAAGWFEVLDQLVPADVYPDRMVGPDCDRDRLRTPIRATASRPVAPMATVLLRVDRADLASQRAIGLLLDRLSDDRATRAHTVILTGHPTAALQPLVGARLLDRIIWPSSSVDLRAQLAAMVHDETGADPDQHLLATLSDAAEVDGTVLDQLVRSWLRNGDLVVFDGRAGLRPDDGAQLNEQHPIWERIERAGPAARSVAAALADVDPLPTAIAISQLQRLTGHAELEVRSGLSALSRLGLLVPDDHRHEFRSELVRRSLRSNLQSVESKVGPPLQTSSATTDAASVASTILRQLREHRYDELAQTSSESAAHPARYFAAAATGDRVAAARWRPTGAAADFEARWYTGAADVLLEVDTDVRSAITRAGQLARLGHDADLGVAPGSVGTPRPNLAATLRLLIGDVGGTELAELTVTHSHRPDPVDLGTRLLAGWIQGDWSTTQAASRPLGLSRDRGLAVMLPLQWRALTAAVAETWLAAGHLVRARQWLDRAEPPKRRPAADVVGVEVADAPGADSVVLVRAKLAALAGDTDRARTWLPDPTRLTSAADLMACPPTTDLGLAQLSRLELAAGQRAAAAAAADALTELADIRPTIRTELLSHLGQARLAEGRAEAVSAAESGYKLAADAGWTWWRAEAALLLSETGADPAVHLAEALGLFHDLGADLVRACAIGRADPTVLNVLDEQRRDTEDLVLRLVAQGLPNRVIATALHRPMKVVEKQVGHWLSRTGSTSRVELAVRFHTGQLDLS